MSRPHETESTSKKNGIALPEPRRPRIHFERVRGRVILTEGPRLARSDPAPGKPRYVFPRTTVTLPNARVCPQLCALGAAETRSGCPPGWRAWHHSSVHDWQLAISGCAGVGSASWQPRHKTRTSIALVPLRRASIGVGRCCRACIHLVRQSRGHSSPFPSSPH